MMSGVRIFTFASSSLACAREAAKQIHHLGGVLVHLVLLDGRPEDHGARWKSLLAHGVLGMKMGGGQVQAGGFGELFGLLDDDRSVARAESGIDDQRGAVPHYNADVGKPDDRVDVFGHAGHRVLRQHHGLLGEGLLPEAEEQAEQRKHGRNNRIAKTHSDHLVLDAESEAGAPKCRM